MGFLSEISLQFVLSIIFIMCLIFYYTMCLIFYRSNSADGKHLRKIPGPVLIPVFGFDILVTIFLAIRYKYRKDIRGDVLKVLADLKQTYGDVYRGCLGDGPVVFLNSYQTASVLLRSAEIDKGKEYDLFRNLIGDGVFSANGEKWKQCRKIVNPSFSTQHVHGLQTVFAKQSNVLVQKLQDEILIKKSQPFDLEPFLGRCLIDIIVESLTRKDIESQIQPNSEVFDAIECLMTGVVDKLWKPWLRSNFIWSISGRAKIEKQNWAVIKQVIDDVFLEQIQARNTKEKYDEPSKAVLLDILLQEQESSEGTLTNAEILEEIVSMIAGARDTGTRTALFTLFLLAVNPKDQKKVQEEIDNFLIKTGTDLSECDLMDELKYLECCIQEAIRLYPPIPIFSRILKNDLDLENGMIIPKGTSCAIVPPIIHRDPEVYPEPEVFNPNRFSNDSLIEPYAYLPFSNGRRNCPGKKFAILAEKYVVASVLANFNVKCAKSREDVAFTMDFLLKPSEVIPFIIEPRVRD